MLRTSVLHRLALALIFAIATQQAEAQRSYDNLDRCVSPSDPPRWLSGGWDQWIWNVSPSTNDNGCIACSTYHVPCLYSPTYPAVVTIGWGSSVNGDSVSAGAIEIFGSLTASLTCSEFFVDAGGHMQGSVTVIPDFVWTGFDYDDVESFNLYGTMNGDLSAQAPRSAFLIWPSGVLNGNVHLDQGVFQVNGSLFGNLTAQSVNAYGTITGDITAGDVYVGHGVTTGTTQANRLYFWTASGIWLDMLQWSCPGATLTIPHATIDNTTSPRITTADTINIPHGGTFSTANRSPPLSTIEADVVNEGLIALPLHITKSYTQTAQGSFNAVLGYDQSPPPMLPVMQVDGTATLAGSLSVSITGAIPSSAVLLSATQGIQGTFSQVSVSVNGQPFAMNVEYTATEVMLGGKPDISADRIEWSTEKENTVTLEWNNRTDLPEETTVA